MPVQQLTNNQKLAQLYQADKTAWLETMSRLIGQRKLARLDYDNLATYLDDMARWDRRELESRFQRFLFHSLKWIHQPEQRTCQRLETIWMERFELNSMLTSKVLEAHARERLTELYEKARIRVLRQRKLPAKAIPADSNPPLEQLLSDDWPPDLFWRPKRQKDARR